MKQAWIYSLKVWLTAILLAPIPLRLITLSDPPIRSISSEIFFVAIMIAASLFLFIHSILIFTFILNEMMSPDMKLYLVKLKASLLAVVSTVVTFQVLHMMFDWYVYHYRLWTICCCLMMILGIWFYKLEPVNKEVNANNI